MLEKGASWYKWEEELRVLWREMGKKQGPCEAL